MNKQLVKEMEEIIEEAIAQAIRDQLADAVPARPSPRTLHLMAKAAVTVYEATLDKTRH